MRIVKFTVDGPINEMSSLFNLKFDVPSEINLDMSKASYINSVGVKRWIAWMAEAPEGSRFHLHRCPFVIINQSVIVDGFLPANGYLMSFFVPYHCKSCLTEESFLLERGVHFEYPEGGKRHVVNYPVRITCPKCSLGMAPDFISEKTFKFLRRT